MWIKRREQPEARTLGRVQNELDQTELGHVGEGKRKGMYFSILCR